MTVLKIILLVYVVCESCQAYHRYGNLKSDHKNSLWSNKLYSGAPSSSTASSLSWYRSNHRYGTTTTTQAPHHIRHSGYGSRYPKLDGVMHRLNPSKKTNPVHGKKSSDHLWDNYYEDNDYDEDDVLEESMGKEEDVITEDDRWRVYEARNCTIALERSNIFYRDKYYWNVKGLLTNSKTNEVHFCASFQVGTAKPSLN